MDVTQRCLLDALQNLGDQGLAHHNRPLVAGLFQSRQGFQLRPAEGNAGRVANKWVVTRNEDQAVLTAAGPSVR